MDKINFYPPQPGDRFWQFRIVDLLALTAIVAIVVRIMGGGLRGELNPLLMLTMIAVWVAWPLSLMERGRIVTGLLLFALNICWLLWPAVH
jgi:hypothetical protein